MMLELIRHLILLPYFERTRLTSPSSVPWAAMLRMHPAPRALKLGWV